MSIFKDTLKPFVQNQLEARKRIVAQYGDTGKVDSNKKPIYNFNSGNPRDERFLRYTTGKNGWVKLQSFVDFDGKIGSKTYKGNELARKYILEGGTLHQPNKNQNLFTLREGVNLQSAVYASDLDLGGNRPLGYRPMPGISSVQVTNKSAYGSLREATVKFYAWDKHQLEELEVLYMRTGYSLLLEWGWSQYLNSSNIDDIKIENFTKPTIDAFYDLKILQATGSSTPDEVLYKKIEDLQESSYGNYDAMLGYVKNFSWQLLDNGGFECTTVLISRGEIISTLRLNSNGPTFKKTTSSVSAPPLSLFENIMLNYTALLNNMELDPVRFGQFTSGSSTITAATANELKNDMVNRSNNVQLLDAEGKRYNGAFIETLDVDDYGKILLTEGTSYNVGIEYMRLNTLICILNLYFNYKDDKNRIISQIIIPRGTPCLASSDSVSIDSTTCIVFNNQAKFISGDATNGAWPKTLYSTDSDTYRVDTAARINDDEQYLDSDGNGQIGRIFVSIPKMLEIYRSKGSQSSDVVVIDFLKDLLNQISKALGGINDFALHTTKSTIQIIDLKYLEKKQGKKDKYILDVIGLKSVCRDVKISSRIFESQSTMIGIAAQSRSNIGNLYTSTQIYFNQGLRDRISLDKIIYNEPGVSKLDETKRIFGDLVALKNYLNRKCLGVIKPGYTSVYQIIIPTPEEINNAASLYKSFTLQLQNEIDYKDIIPFELEIVLDGISGLVQGQIFKIDTNLLPFRYNQVGIGFIITGIQHSLQNNDWITTVKTQMCILDSLKDNAKIKLRKDLEDALQNLMAIRASNIILWDALSDYMLYTADSFYKIISNSSYNALSVNTTAPPKAVFALAKAGAIVYKASVDPNSDPNASRVFFSGYKDYNGATPHSSDAPNKRGGAFGYLLDPDFGSYFNNTWLPAAKTKYASNSDAMAVLNRINNLNDVKSVAETDGGGKTFYIPGGGLLAYAADSFLSYPLKLKSQAEFTGGINYRFKESFLLRSTDYVDFIKANGERQSDDPRSFLQPTGSPTFFTPFGNDFFTNSGTNNFYKNRPTNQFLKTIFYKYIIDNAGTGKYWDVDPLFIPAYDGSKTLTIYNLSASTL